MSRFPMNPYDEQRLIEEVRYLHSLWHQGPPHPHVHPNLHPQTPVSLQPSGSTQFKKQNKQKSKRLKEALIDSGVGWVFPIPAESSPVTDSGWPSFTAQPSLQPQLPTAEELASVAGNRAQQQGLKAVSEYLKYSVDDDEEEMYDDDDDDMEVEKEEKKLNFFAKLFEEDGGLREYYEKNNESGGEFICLVCSGVGKKGWSKRFKDCVGLVQHSITISNTRQAHRAFGQVICRILGWDINRLPSIVLSAGGKPSESSDKPVEAQVLGSELQTSSLANSNDGFNKTLQGNEDAGGKDCLSGLSNTTDAVNVGTDELSQQKQSFSNENQQENGGGSTALEHNSVIEANVSNEIPETAKENTKGASNCPEPLPDDMIVANEENNDVSKETTIASEES
ncbi:uncharacterized protein [Solanum tuberosum]|uniref:uncharacterized protein isoform X5 n=1 Tax=Solanum tuberosum TaxID=4113 RepID=UPI00073A3194|nr:PREDICTED: uncharacterized protein LOC102583466 isoform X5 [Solanum tuberosum]